MITKKRQILALEHGLFYAAMAGVSLGIALQQISLGLFALTQILVALVYGLRLGSFLGPGRRMALAFLITTIFCAVIAQRTFPVPSATRIHWAICTFWVIAPSIAVRVNWQRLYHVMLWVSVPSLIYSVYWLLRPAEIEWALGAGGFDHYPRAAGFVSNPITYAESIVVLAGWTMARLHYATPSPRERKLMYAHLALSILVILFSRVRSGILGFAVLFLLNAILTPRFRKWGLALCVAVPLLFTLNTLIFGFNIASIAERVELAQQSLTLFAQNPIFGIGPNKFLKVLPEIGQMPQHPHNTLLGMATEFGILGLVAYLAFMVSLAWQLRQLVLRHRREHDELTWVVHALLFAFISYHLFGLFDYNYADTELLIMHALNWGLIAHLAHRPTSTASGAPLDSVEGEST